MARKTKRSGRPQAHSIVVGNYTEDAQSSDSDDYGSDDDFYYSKRLDPVEDELKEDDCSSAGNDGQEELSGPPAKKRRHSRAYSAQPTLSWKTEKHKDKAPPRPRFQPARTPGVQVSAVDTHTPLDLFKLFFSEKAVKTLCSNTNKQAAINIAKGCAYGWTDVGVQELYTYIGLVFYTAMFKLDEIKDYWQQDDIFSIPFPVTVMSWDRYRCITWNIKMSDPCKDPENDIRRGTPTHDSLFQAKPLLDLIRTACKAFYHPHKNLVMRDGITSNRSFKLFVLADAGNDYAVDLAVYRRHSSILSGQGISYNSVMSLMNSAHLGSGYHLYTDSFYTSPKLFTDLHGQSFGACGPYRQHRAKCPRSTANALDKTSAKGAIRWIRSDPLLFVKWMDRREVSVCSTIHAAYSGDKVQGWVKPKTGGSLPKTFPCPSSVMDYNKHAGGAEWPYQLFEYYTTQHKAMKWYRKLFLSLLDIAAMNAYILHKELTSKKQQATLKHKAFMEELIAQLCGVSDKTPSKRTCLKHAPSDHVPVPAVTPHPAASKRASSGHKTCLMCEIDNKKRSTQWKCKVCDVGLCLELDKNCFERWHK